MNKTHYLLLFLTTVVAILTAYFVIVAVIPKVNTFMAHQERQSIANQQKELVDKEAREAKEGQAIMAEQFELLRDSWQELIKVDDGGAPWIRPEAEKSRRINSDLDLAVSRAQWDSKTEASKLALLEKLRQAWIRALKIDVNDKLFVEHQAELGRILLKDGYVRVDAISLGGNRRAASKVIPIMMGLSGEEFARTLAGQ